MIQLMLTAGVRIAPPTSAPAYVYANDVSSGGVYQVLVQWAAPTGTATGSQVIFNGQLYPFGASATSAYFSVSGPGSYTAYVAYTNAAGAGPYGSATATVAAGLPTPNVTLSDASFYSGGTKTRRVRLSWGEPPSGASKVKITVQEGTASNAGGVLTTTTTILARLGTTPTTQYDYTLQRAPSPSNAYPVSTTVQWLDASDYPSPADSDTLYYNDATVSQTLPPPTPTNVGSFDSSWYDDVSQTWHRRITVTFNDPGVNSGVTKVNIYFGSPYATGVNVTQNYTQGMSGLMVDVPTSNYYSQGTVTFYNAANDIASAPIPAVQVS